MNEKQEITIVGVSIPFGSLVAIVLKFWFATAFAGAFLFVLFLLGSVAFSLLFGWVETGEPIIHNIF